MNYLHDLFAAIKSGQISLVNKALSNVSDINEPLGDDYAIVAAVESGFSDAVDVLIAHGANLEVKNKSGNDLKSIAMQNGDMKMWSKLNSGLSQKPLRREVKQRAAYEILSESSKLYTIYKDFNKVIRMLSKEDESVLLNALINAESLERLRGVDSAVRILFHVAITNRSERAFINLLDLKDINEDMLHEVLGDANKRASIILFIKDTIKKDIERRGDKFPYSDIWQLAYKASMWNQNNAADLLIDIIKGFNSKQREIISKNVLYSAAIMPKDFINSRPELTGLMNDILNNLHKKSWNSLNYFSKTVILGRVISPAELSDPLKRGFLKDIGAFNYIDIYPFLIKHKQYALMDEFIKDKITSNWPINFIASGAILPINSTFGSIQQIDTNKSMIDAIEGLTFSERVELIDYSLSKGADISFINFSKLFEKTVKDASVYSNEELQKIIHNLYMVVHYGSNHGLNLNESIVDNFKTIYENINKFSPYLLGPKEHNLHVCEPLVSTSKKEPHELSVYDDLNSAGLLSRILNESGHINSFGFDGLTPLMIAAKDANPKMVLALIEHGADPFLEDENGLNAFAHLSKSRKVKDKEKCAEIISDFSMKTEQSKTYKTFKY